MLIINTDRRHIECSETQETEIKTNHLLFNNFSSEKEEQEDNCKLLENKETQKIKKLFQSNHVILQ